MKLVLVLILTGFYGWVNAQNLPPLQKEVLQKNEQLKFLEGNWNLQVSYYSREGQIIRQIQSKASVRQALDGLIYSISYFGEIQGKQKEVILNWIFYNKNENEFFDIMYDLGARYELRHGDFNNQGDLILMMDEPIIMPDSGGKESIWKKTFYNISKSSFELKYEYTEDGGSTWILFTREIYNKTT